ncbi:MAG: glycosyltransferase, partial [Phycisphaerae bacterium]
LIRHAATHLPEADFVFVGPYGSSSEIAQLESFKNVTFLGARAYDEVPAYVSTFDVCWVPFRVGGIAAAANPIKIYEYLALGRPVVSTPVADTDGFEGLVRVGRTAGEVTDLLREALAATPADTDRRVAFARRNSWDDRAAEIVEFLDALKRRAG